MVDSVLRREVIAGWIDFSRPLEGRVRHLYLDARGFPTTAIGILVPTVGASQRLPWEHANGTPATQDEIAADYSRVKALPPYWTAWRYAGSSPLVLSDDAIDALVLRRLHENVETLVLYYPNLASYPAPAQMAICSLAWACGAGFPPSWPKLSAEVRRRAWKEAAEECAISAVGNPGVIARNAATRQLFLQAAEGA